jgi:hypothetical protein
VIVGPPDLTSTVESFSMPMVIRDYGATTTTADGMLAAGATSDTSSIGHYFPAPGDAIERLELQSPGSVFEVHVPRDAVLVARKGDQQRGSLLVFAGGRTFEVVGIGEWFHGTGAGGYRQCWAQEVVR